ncbi:MAG: hypothetical protein ACKOE2_12235 [Actinomycetales bacterium]
MIQTLLTEQEQARWVSQDRGGTPLQGRARIPGTMHVMAGQCREELARLNQSRIQFQTARHHAVATHRPHQSGAGDHGRDSVQVHPDGLDSKVIMHGRWSHG